MEQTPKQRRTDSDDARREMDEATRVIISAIHSEIKEVKAELRDQAVKLEAMKGVLEVWASAKGFVTVVKWFAMLTGGLAAFWLAFIVVRDAINRIRGS